MIDLSVLIVNWNTRDLVAQCLESLAGTADQMECNCAGEDPLVYDKYRAEVLIVDNASTDGSAAMIRQHFPWAQLIENERNVGFAPANNQAYERSTGRYVLLLNSDTEVRPNAIRRLIDFMDTHADCGAGGARLLNADGSLQPSCQPMLTPWREFWRLMFLDRLWRRATYDMARWPIDQPQLVETIKGACLIVRRAALDQAAPLLDEQYFMYTEEVDLCYRLAGARWKLYWIPQSVVTHFGEASSRQVYNQMYVQLYRSKVQFCRKFGGERRVRQFKLLVVAAYLPRLIAARLMMLSQPMHAARVQTFKQLLAELRRM